MPNTPKAGRFLWISVPIIVAALRVRTQRSLEGDSGRDIIHILRGNDPVGRDTLLDPSFEGLQNVVLGIEGRAVNKISEGVWAGSAATMRHSRHHEDTVEDA